MIDLHYLTEAVLDKPFAETIAGQVFIPTMSALLVAMLLGGAAGLRKIIRAQRLAREAADERDKKSDARLDKLATVVESIRHEVHPNSGTSLKDAVNRIEAEQSAQGRRLDEHIQQGKYDLARIDAALTGRVVPIPTPPTPGGAS